MIINPIPSVDNVGGKGYQLTLLQRISMVPKFFLISFEDSSEILRDDIQKQIIEYYDVYKFDRVAVRSSATMEDSTSASFAGMFESVLNVTKKELISAIQIVLESIKDKRVKEYCDYNGLDYSAIKMCVVVQQMVDSRVSGVCITKEKKADNTMLLEACYGLGEALVSGLITPDTYRVDRNTLIVVSQNIGFQKLMYDYSTKGTPVPVPFHKRNAKKLKDKEISEIVNMALTIERNLNYKAADIEWAYEKDVLYLLQVRPFLGI